MTTRHLIHDAGHCLRAAVPPVLTLGVLTATRAVLLASPRLSPSAESLLQLAWHCTIVAGGSWLVVSLCWAASRPWRDRRASKRLQHLRDLATEPNRALVHVTTVFGSNTAGQHAIVVNVATGISYRVWIPEMDIPVGAFAVLERSDSGVRHIAALLARRVEAAHRHESRREPPGTSVEPGEPPSQAGENTAATALISEIEAFLKGSTEGR